MRPAPVSSPRRALTVLSRAQQARISAFIQASRNCSGFRRSSFTVGVHGPEVEVGLANVERQQL